MYAGMGDRYMEPLFNWRGNECTLLRKKHIKNETIIQPLTNGKTPLFFVDARIFGVFSQYRLPLYR